MIVGIVVQKSSSGCDSIIFLLFCDSNDEVNKV